MADTELRRWAIDAAVRSGSPDIIGTATVIVEFVEGGVERPQNVVQWMKWTDDRMAYLKEARASGTRPREIIRGLNKLPGPPISRGAVAGMMWRLRLPNPGAHPSHVAHAAEMRAARQRKRGLNGTAG